MNQQRHNNLNVIGNQTVSNTTNNANTTNNVTNNCINDDSSVLSNITCRLGNIEGKVDTVNKKAANGGPHRHFVNQALIVHLLRDCLT